MRTNISVDISNYINKQDKDYQIFSVMKRNYGQQLKKEYKSTNDSTILNKINELIRSNTMKVIKDLKSIGHKCEGCDCNPGAMRIFKTKEGVNDG